MRLVYTCRHCRSLNEVSLNATDRSQIRDGHPDGLSLICGTCHKENNIEPNDIKARKSKYIGLITILGLLLSIVIGAVFLSKYWANNLGRDLYVLAVFAAIISLPPIVSNLYIKSERKAVKSFNSHYV